MTLDDLTVAPWHRFQWGGELRSIDGTSATDFAREDVAELVACSAGWDVWDGMAAIVRLHDGRFVSWEAGDDTGDGFRSDLYGGPAGTDILFAATAKMAARGISEQGRDSLAWLVMP